MEYNHINTSYLAHHGVKGMKWGVRHDKKKVWNVEASSKK